ncbi:uncharacterized protein V6R79_009385 [Siganus canaliculatus]
MRVLPCVELSGITRRKLMAALSRCVPVWKQQLCKRHQKARGKEGHGAGNGGWEVFVTPGKCLVGTGSDLNFSVCAEKMELVLLLQLRQSRSVNTQSR